MQNNMTWDKCHMQRVLFPLFQKGFPFLRHGYTSACYSDAKLILCQVGLLFQPHGYQAVPMLFTCTVVLQIRPIREALPYLWMVRFILPKRGVTS